MLAEEANLGKTRFLAAAGHDINLCVLFGPTLLADLGGPAVDDFQPYQTFVSGDGSGREAKGTQEELLLWWNGTEKDMIWELQFNARTALEGHMKVAIVIHVLIDFSGQSCPYRMDANGLGAGHLAHDIDIMHAAIDDRAD